MLIDSHVLDSLDMIRLVSMIERDLGVDIQDEDLVPQNFGTIGRITAFVESRRN